MSEPEPKTFGEMSPAERDEWLAADPTGYFAAGRAWARESVRREATAADRWRRRVARRRRFAWFRRLVGWWR